MLKQLYIQNYAIIDELEISFSPKMNVITGETGAGKSIIMGALGLILGERADSSVLVNKNRKCVVEGSFFCPNKKAVAEFLSTNELDESDDLVIRREIASNGKSRAFINDTPANLLQLQELSALLVDLHQQFDTLELARNEFQMEVLDALAGQFDRLNDYRLVYRQWQELRRTTEELKARQLQFEKESDYHRFQFNELADAAFRENELEDLESELKLLNNSEEITQALNKAGFLLQDSEEPVVQQLKVIANQLSAYSSFNNELGQLVERLRSAQIELQDIASGIEQVNGKISHDPGRIEQLNERLSLGYRLLKKHGLRTTSELLSLRNELEQKIQAVLGIGEELQQKEKEKEILQARATKLANELSADRGSQVTKLETKVNKLLAQVGMPNARLKVTVRKGTELGADGLDEVEFLFDGNKSGQYQPLRKVASGGELSRLMLCIKSLVAQSVDLPTMIFDEIDTGISGEAARQVGLIMKQMATKRQIICITHQPQIAGKAEAHYFVFKEIAGETVKTNIRQLDNEERITAIAKMLSGEKPTAAAMENAREMLN